jgi:hypothetical protein
MIGRDRDARPVVTPRLPTRINLSDVAADGAHAPPMIGGEPH